MPLNLLNRNSLLCTALCAGLAALVLFSAPARAEDDDDDGGPDIKLFKSVLSAVGLRTDSPNIDYRERSPLVIPSDTSKLRPPTAEEIKNPNWPVDPDTKRRRELAAAKARSQRDTGNPQIDDARVLAPNELNQRDRTKRNTGAGYTEWTGKPMSPSELGSPGLFNQLGKVFDNSDKEEAAKFTGEPPRTSLLEPPSGYQTPSPSQPYGLGKGSRGGPTAADYYGTHGTIEGVH